MILGELEMIRKLIDPARQDGNLHFGEPVSLVAVL
jgi:hypothetical protein